MKRKEMTKTEAVDAISRAASAYELSLNNQNLMIIYGQQVSGTFKNIQYIETISTDSRFLHLTGVELNSKLDKASFFTKALNNQLTPNDFSFKDNTTILKLKVLEKALNIPKNFRMYGDYNGSRPHLQADKLIGGEKSSLGFIKNDNGYYYPITVLKGDVRQDVKETQQVLAVLKKDTVDREYTEFEYLAKNVFAHKLLETLKSKNPQIPLEPLRVNYQSLLDSQQAKEAEFLKQRETEKHKEQLGMLSDELSKCRECFISSGDSGDMKMYLEAQGRFLEAADRATLYEYAKELLKEQEKTYKDNSEILSYIGEETKELQIRQDQDELSPRKADITVGIRNLKLDADRNSAALNAAQVHTISVPIPPKRPFKALYIKIRDAVKELFSKNGKKDAPESLPNKQGSSGDGDGNVLLKEERTEDLTTALTQDVVVKTSTTPEISDNTPPETASETILREPVPEACKLEAETLLPVAEASEAASVKKEAKPKTKKSKQFEYGD